MAETDIDFLAMPSAVAIRDAFLDYNLQFSNVTKRAKERFEQRDWSGSRDDANARIELYDQCIADISDKLSERMADRSNNAILWQGIRQAYENLISPLLDRELFKTFSIR
ncbi:MAG: isocitrate dehydrogenase kinase/phosphatase AceK regulatory subunit [Methylococcales bacterium]